MAVRMHWTGRGPINYNNPVNFCARGSTHSLNEHFLCQAMCRGHCAKCWDPSVNTKHILGPQCCKLPLGSHWSLNGPGSSLPRGPSRGVRGCILTAECAQLSHRSSLSIHGEEKRGTAWKRHFVDWQILHCCLSIFIVIITTEWGAGHGISGQSSRGAESTWSPWKPSHRSKTSIDLCSLTCHLQCFDPVKAPLLKAHKKYFLTVITGEAQYLCRKKSW